MSFNPAISFSLVKALLPIIFTLAVSTLHAYVDDNTLTCPDDLTINLQVGECGDQVFFDTLTWESTDELVDTLFFPPSGSFLPIGNNTVTIAATTVNGDLQSCNFTVHVNEYVAQSIDCIQNVQLSLNGLCEREVTADELLDPDSIGCVNNYQVVKIGPGGTILPPTINAFDIGQTYTFVVQHISNGLQCSTEVTIVGGSPPSIICPPDITIVCSIPLTPENVGMPDTTGCYEDIELEYYDVTTIAQCPDSIGFQKKRFWIATDPFGNKDTCDQIITGMRYDISQVVFPADFDGTDNPALVCSTNGTWQDVATTDITGVPLFMGDPANTNPECSVTSNYQDIATKICGATYDIARVWTVVNICSPNATVRDTQYIKVIDTIPPAFSVPDTIFASTSMDCFDSLYIPGAFEIVECSSYETIIYTTWDTVFANGGWSSIDLNVGTYPVFYTMEDDCGNSSFAFSQIVVQESTVAKCPPNDTIDCDYFFETIEPAIILGNFDTLAALGMPEFPGNCTFDVSESDTESVNDCGVGEVIRTLTIESSTPEVCVQVITVEHVSNFDAIFPVDTSICVTPGAANLPFPQLFNFNCEDVTTDRDDDTVSDGPNGCYTLKRKWILIDECQYTGVNNNDDIVIGDRHIKDGGDGIIEYVQTVIVNSTNGPGFPEGCEIEDIYVDENSCNQTITVPTPIVSGCRDIETKIFGDLGLVMGIDVQLGLGTYNVSYTAKDECGKMGVCQTQFEVLDSIPPNAVCEGAILVELMAPSGPNQGPFVIVDAEDLNNSSSDNCVGPLFYSFDSDGQILTQLYTCDELGIQSVTIWVTDIFGNQSSCSSQIYVQDNIITCDSPEPIVSGTVETELGVGIFNVEVESAYNSGNSTVLTNGDGAYLETVPAGSNVEITPSKNVNHSNGVTTFDAVIMTRHILGVELINSPYKLIAADINNSGTVTTFDIVEMRKLILSIYSNFPNNSSWRFVPANYVFPNPQNPWEVPFPESINVINVVADVPDQDFIGIKIGDLNGSANPMN